MTGILEAKLLISQWFEIEGYKVEYNKEADLPFDLILSKDSFKAIVQIKNFKSATNNAQIVSFERFLQSKEGKKYQKAYLLSKNGFTRSVFKNLSEKVYSDKLVFGLFFNDEEKKSVYPSVIHSIELYEEQKAIFDEFNFKQEKLTLQNKSINIAVCTCKGGVGKTTVSAHLAGAFTLLDFETALVDCDPEHHLTKLLDPDILEKGEGEGIILDETEKPLICYTKEKWKEEEQNIYPVVIYDCAPSKESNDPSIFKNSDFCIIPINLCPLGVGKNIDVIKDTFQYLQKINPKIQCLVLINNRLNREHKVAIELKEKLINEVQKYGAHLIEPDIRHSEQLYYWGAESRKLAFKEIAGKCYPKQDFTILAEWLVRFMNIQNKKQSKKIA
jgi:chromosome partitioning protein